MDGVLLIGLVACMAGGIILGFIVGAVIGHDIFTAKSKDDYWVSPLAWSEDLDDPEGEWKGEFYG